MSYKEFTQERERRIARNGMIFDFTRVREHMCIIEVSLASLPKTIGKVETHDWVSCTNIVTDIEAYYVYENILNGGLE